MSTAREEILGRIRVALGDGVRSAETSADRPIATVSPPSTGGGPLVEQFAGRCSEYRAVVRRTNPRNLAATLASICAEHGARRLACPADIPSEWRPPGVELLPDEPALSPLELDQVDGVLTGCRLAAAETGTIVLDHGSRQGRRALTLVPDLHLCVIAVTQVVADIPDTIPALACATSEGRPVTLVSGPSATSDIELDRVEGVHGPRRLEVVLIEAP